MLISKKTSIERAEKLGEEGKIDESEAIMVEVEKLKK
jgi:hypothetical protein